jgi:hypothetical protein
MRAEYCFDYRQAKPNRFAPRVWRPQLPVVLDPDVAEVFTSSGTVNAFLRAAIAAMPRRKKAKPRSL